MMSKCWKTGDTEGDVLAKLKAAHCFFADTCPRRDPPSLGAFFGNQGGPVFGPSRRAACRPLRLLGSPVCNEVPRIPGASDAADVTNREAAICWDGAA